MIPTFPNKKKVISPLRTVLGLESKKKKFEDKRLGALPDEDRSENQADLAESSTVIQQVGKMGKVGYWIIWIKTERERESLKDGFHL